MTMPPEEVRFPQMRNEILYAVSALADEGYQREVWLGHHSPRSPYEYDFDMACHAILDDTLLLSDPDRMIGEVLLNQEELEALLALARQLLLVINEIGQQGEFTKAQASAQWKDVVRAATQAASTLGRPSQFP